MSKKARGPRRTFQEEFKRDAVSLVVNKGYSIKQAADAVGVAPRSIRDWLEKYAPEPEPCGDDATKGELANEIKLLRKKLQQAELERDILKKATAYFAKESL